MFFNWQNLGYSSRKHWKEVAISCLGRVKKFNFICYGSLLHFCWWHFYKLEVIKKLFPHFNFTYSQPFESIRSAKSNAWVPKCRALLLSLYPKQTCIKIYIDRSCNERHWRSILIDLFGGSKIVMSIKCKHISFKLYFKYGLLIFH